MATSVTYRLIAVAEDGTEHEVQTLTTTNPRDIIAVRGDMHAAERDRMRAFFADYAPDNPICFVAPGVEFLRLEVVRP